MANKQINEVNLARDLGATGQNFALKLIDNGTSYSLYVEDLGQSPTQPAISSQITATGLPVIAPSGAGDVIGIGTTNSLVKWTNGPLSVVGDSLITDDGQNINVIAIANGIVTITSGVSVLVGIAAGAINITGGAGLATGTGSRGGTINITGGNSNGDGTVARAGGFVNIQGGQAVGTNVGGQVGLIGGLAAAIAGSTGGTISIISGGGSTTGTGGDAGSLFIQCGNAGGDGTVARIGGPINMTAGQSVGAQIGGAVTISGGAGSITGAGGNGGLVTIRGGAAGAIAGSVGGSVAITGRNGSVTGTGAGGGSVTLTGGAAGGSGANNGGSIILSPGAKTGAGVAGTIVMNASVNAAADVDLGSTTTPLRNIFFYGSGTFATTSIELTGTPTGARITTFPDSNTTIPIAAQQLTFAGPSQARTITFPDAAITVARSDAAQTLTGNQTINGNVILNTAGNVLSIKEGVNATMGTGVLNGATEVTINTTAVTANSRIFLSIQAPGGTPLGLIYVSSRVAGTSFGVKGAATDTSTFAWHIIEPA